MGTYSLKPFEIDVIARRRGNADWPSFCIRPFVIGVGFAMSWFCFAISFEHPMSTKGGHLAH
jgi:hypothetical protein